MIVEKDEEDGTIGNGVLDSIIVEEGSTRVKSEEGSALNANHPSVAKSGTRGRKRMIFSHLPAVTTEARETFVEVQGSIYQFDDLGESQQQDVMACECKPLISGITHATL